VLRDARGKQATISLRGRFESDDSVTVAGAVYPGLGSGVRPVGEVMRDSVARRVVHLLARWYFRSDCVYLVSPPGRLRLPRVRAVAAIIDSIAGVLG
jgi:DNA-binding transcriptional LysR family regulator